MSNLTIIYHDDNQIDYDELQEVPSSINVGSSHSHPKQDAVVVNVELPKGNMWPSSPLSSKVRFNKSVVPINKQGDYELDGYLCNLELSVAPLDPKFGLVSHFVSNHYGNTDAGNKTKQQYIQEAFVSIVNKLEDTQLKCTQYDFMDIFVVPTSGDKNASHPTFIKW